MHKLFRTDSSRPRSKSAAKTAILTDPEHVLLAPGDPYDSGYRGRISELPVGKTVHVAGPNLSYTALITRTESGFDVK